MRTILTWLGIGCAALAAYIAPFLFQFSPLRSVSQLNALTAKASTTRRMNPARACSWFVPPVDWFGDLGTFKLLRFYKDAVGRSHCLSSAA
jgi:hypothetical protein